MSGENFRVVSQAAEARHGRAGGGHDEEVEVQRGADRVRAEAGGVGHDAGRAICRKLGVMGATFYRWKKKFAGMGVSEVRRLKQLEEENRKLKQLVADLSLDKAMLQEVVRKKP